MMIRAENSISAEDSELINCSSGCMLRFIQSGSGIQTAGKDSWLLRQGDFFLCAPNTSGTFYAISDCTMTDISFPPELAELSGLPIRDVVIRSIPQDMLSGLLPVCSALTEKKSVRCNYILAEQLSLFAKIALVFLQNGSVVNLIRQRMANVLIFIHSNYQRDITLHDLADVAGTSVSHLRRQFMQSTGKAAIDYLLDFRLAKAAKCLNTTSSSVARIALENGFNDANYFTRAFTHKYHTSPRSWRKNNSEK